MRAVTSIFVALAWLRTLSERMVSFQAGETKFGFGNSHCSVGGPFIKKHATVPQRMVVFAHNTVSCTRLSLVPVPFEDALELAAAKTFAPVFVRVTDCVLSSLLVLWLKLSSSRSRVLRLYLLASR